MFGEPVKKNSYAEKHSYIVKKVYALLRWNKDKIQGPKYQKDTHTTQFA